MASDQGQMVFLVYRKMLVPHIPMRIWFFIRRSLRKDGRTRASNVYIDSEKTIISGLHAHQNKWVLSSPYVDQHHDTNMIQTTVSTDVPLRFH